MLRQVEDRFPNEVVVVGVHSPKFTTERAPEHVAAAVARLSVEHPVISDPDHTIWNSYAVRAWPTLMFIDPAGKVIGQVAGEVAYADLARTVAAMLAGFDNNSLIDRRPLPLPKPQPRDLSELSFPGRVHVAGDRLFVADSEHHRILIAGLDGRVQAIIGSGTAGLRDGSFHSATFNSPQGLALVDQTLFVADERNHCIRAVDFESGTVSVVAGTGEKGRRPVPSGPATTTALNSPWGLAWRQGVLYIAMAGFHQLWTLSPTVGEVAVYAGTGHEDIRDGPRHSAWLSQPSGVALGGDDLYFADSEDSAIRYVDASGAVHTVAGTGLFDFGDVDGIGGSALLQHPLDVAYHDTVVYVADTYNNKIKRIFPHMRAVETFLGSGQAGHRDGCGGEAELAEPGGLSVYGNHLYIADTNNHAIRIAELMTREVTTLELHGL